MIAWVLLIIMIVLAVEYCIRLSCFLKWVQELLATYGKIFRVIRSKASDHWKEKLVPAYTFRTMRYLCLLLIWFIGLAIILIAPVMVIDSIGVIEGEVSIQQEMLSYPILIGSIPISVLYFLVRKRLKRG